MRDIRSAVWRSRWAAIGAAAAVTLGAGGLFVARAATTTTPNSFVAIDPVRVLDTRINAGLTGAFTSNVGRDLQITGMIPIVQPSDVIGSGNPVPAGATAIVANLTAVSPTTIGWVSARAGGKTDIPTTSNINITAPGQIVPNSVTIPLSASGQVNLWFSGTSSTASVHLLLDVVGYYRTDPAFGGVMPSGSTVTGEIFYDESAATADADYIQVVFPARAPLGLLSSTVNFAPDASGVTTDDDPACTGTVNAPTAPTGKVCIYLNTVGGLATVDGYRNLTLTDRGFTVHATPSAANSNTRLSATWAYTAP